VTLVAWLIAQANGWWTVEDVLILAILTSIAGGALAGAFLSYRNALEG
jgi:hypothetical protein